MAETYAEAKYATSKDESPMDQALSTIYNRIGDLQDVITRLEEKTKKIQIPMSVPSLSGEPALMEAKSANSAHRESLLNIAARIEGESRRITNLIENLEC